MSVIGFAADEIKSLEAAARDLCGEHVGGELWPTLYVSNLNEYAKRYQGVQLSDQERTALCLEYMATPARDQYTPKDATDLMERLQSLFYNCEDFTGEMEAARRRLLNAVAFELMTPGGPAVNLDTWATVQRLDFDTYQMTTVNPFLGVAGRPYTFARAKNEFHAFEGFKTTDPRQLFRLVWQMRDDCTADSLRRDG